MGSEFSSLYPYSREEARRRNELDEWRKSHNENIRCRNAIETAASAGQNQKEMIARVRKVLDEYGFKRVGYVLSNTIQ